MDRVALMIRIFTLGHGLAPEIWSNEQLAHGDWGPWKRIFRAELGHQWARFFPQHREFLLNFSVLVFWIRFSFQFLV